MNHLLQNLSSQYLEAANRLRPKGSRRRVVAYVESYDDVAFWRLLLDEFEVDNHSVLVEFASLAIDGNIPIVSV